MRFAGKTAVVPGAASGIGKATCLRLASEGATVIAADIDDAGGQELASTSNGTIMVARKTPNKTPLPGNSIPSSACKSRTCTVR